MGLSVNVDDAETTRYDDVKVGDLQEKIQINGMNISGKLKYVEDMSKIFSEEEKSGNFLCLTFDNKTGGTVTTKIKNGLHDQWVDVSDGFCIYKISDPSNQEIVVKVEDDESGEEEISYTLNGLECEGAPD